MGNNQCVILVPANNGIEPACDHALRQLERTGYPVWRVPGFSAIDTARSQIATDAVARGFEELMWIDSDMEFDPAAVERLRSHNLPIVGGLYPKKGNRALASALLPETQKIIFGEGGGLLEIRYAATGFLYTKRQVYLDIQRLCSLPVCNLQFNKPLVPFFMTMVVEVEEEDRRSDVGGQKPEGAWAEAHATGSVADTHSPTHHSPQPNAGGQSPFASPTAQKGTVPAPRHWYLSEDFSFSHRARQAGYKIFADTTIRLGHIGRYSYAWEDAGMTMPRFGAFEFHVSDAKPPANGK
jgi:hypothetical protein